MAESTTYVDFYAILDISETASDEVIKKAIKDQRHVWVKRTALPDLDRRQNAERRVAQLDDAERVLLDSNRRRQFDEQRSVQPAEPIPTFGGSNRLEDALPANESWVDRAREFMQMGQFSSANFAAREALATNETGHEAWSLRAHSALALGEYQEANFSFNEAIRLKPNEAEYHFDLGCAMESAGNDAGAIGKFRDAADLEPSNPVYQTAIAGILLNQGHAAKALPIMEEVVREYPDNSAFTTYLAWALADQFDEYATLLPNGSFILTSEAQAQRMYSDMSRATKLQINDTELRDHIERRRELAREALTKTWKLPRGALGWAWAIAFIVCASVPKVGVALLVGWLACFVYFNFIPRYTAMKREAKAAGVVQKWGI